MRWCRELNSIGRSSLTLMLLMCVGNCGLVYGAADGTPGPRYLLNNDKYYAIEDLTAAAALLKNDAKALRVDPNRVDVGAKTLGNSTRLAVFPSEKVAIDTNDRAYTAELARADGRDLEWDEVGVMLWSRPMTINEVAGLFVEGVRIYKRLDGGYIVRAPRKKMLELAGRDYCSWIGAYLPEYKYNGDPLSSTKRRYVVEAFYKRLPDDFRSDLDGIGVEVVATSKRRGIVTFDADGAQVNSVLRLLWVRSVMQAGGERVDGRVGDLSSARTENAQSRVAGNQSRVLAGGGGAQTGGSPIVVGIIDNRIDSYHTSVSGKLETGSDFGRATDNLQHGTAVAAIILGANESTGCGDLITGVAPEAKCLSYDLSLDLIEHNMDAFVEQSIRVTNHSYSDSLQSHRFKYDLYTMIYDRFAEEEEMIPVVSVGNLGDRFATPDGGNQIENPATGKNVIAVGSILHVSDTMGIHEEIGRRVSGFEHGSSFGPTNSDGRLKPEIMAPGGSYSNVDGTNAYGIVSARSTRGIGQVFNEWCRGDYGTYSGSSYAAPFVTGAIATMLRFAPDRTNNLVKALLINTAIPLVGNAPLSGENENLEAMKRGYCNNEYGYGLVNPVYWVGSGDSSIDRFILDTRESTNPLDATLAKIDRGTSRRFSFPVVSRAGANGDQKPVRVTVTLAYTDHAESPAIMNRDLWDDLDLTLTSASFVEYTPGLAPGVTSESPLEKITVELAPDEWEGDWHADVKFVGEPHSTPWQEFAVVADVIYDTPRLAIEFTDPRLPNDPVEVGSTGDVLLSGQIRNVGGGVAAGVSVRIRQDSPLGEDDDKRYPQFLGNLYKSSGSTDVAPFSFTMKAPFGNGVTSVQLEVGAANLDLAARQVIPIEVRYGSQYDRKGSWLEPRQLGYPTSANCVFDDEDGGIYIAYKRLVNIDPNSYQLCLQQFDVSGTPQYPYLLGKDVVALGPSDEIVDAFWTRELGVVVVVRQGTQLGYYKINRQDGSVVGSYHPSDLNGSLGTLWSAAWDGHGGILASYTNSDNAFHVTSDSLGVRTRNWDRTLDGVQVVQHVLVDGIGGVYLVYDGVIGNESGTLLQHLDNSGMPWSSPMMLSAATGYSRVAVSGPRNGVYIQGQDTIHLVYPNGQRAWGVSGRPWDSDWLIVDQDTRGGLIALGDWVDPPSSGVDWFPLSVNVFGTDMTPKWGTTGRATLPDSLAIEDVGGMINRDDFRCIRSGDGGVIFVAPIQRGNDPTELLIWQFDQSGAPSVPAYYEYATKIERFSGRPDGFGGGVFAYRVWDMPNGVRTLNVVRIGIPNGRDMANIRGRISEVQGGVEPLPSVSIVDGVGASYEVVDLGNGRYSASVPMLSEVSISASTDSTITPGEHFVGVVTEDILADFFLSVPAVKDISASPVLGRYKVTNAADWVDFDSDGDEDLYLSYGEYWPNEATHDASNLLVQNDGSGVLLDITPAASWFDVGWNGPTTGTAWADMDNDGDQDLYMVNGDEIVPNNSNLLFENAPSGGVPVLTRYTLGDVTAFEDGNRGGRAEWVDVDADGDLDLFVGRPGRQSLLLKSWVAQGTDSPTLGVAPGLTDLYTNGYFSWGDYNVDGLPDVFVFGNSGANYLLRNNGDWTFTDVTTAMGLDALVAGYGQAAAWGDFDNDGDFDLYVAFNTGALEPSRLLRNDGSAFTDVSESMELPSVGSFANAAAWMDLENDGDLDLLVSGQPTVVWENKLPIERFVRNMEYEIPSTQEPRTVSIADLDGDGDEDIYVGVRGPVPADTDLSRLYENVVGQEANWVKVDLSGVGTNRDGIGAIVRVSTADGATQTRQLVGSVGGSSHAPKLQTIGLGSHSEARKIRVEWPTGRITEVPHVESGQTVEISDEFPAAQGGELFLTTNSAGIRAGQSTPVTAGEAIHLYLAVDVTALATAGSTIGGVEGRLGIPDNVSVSIEDILLDGIDTDPDPASYSLQFDGCPPASQGPVPLVHLVISVWEEGPDPVITLGNIGSPAFSDPDPSVAITPSWVECSSGVLYRLEDPTLSGGIVIPITDTKSPRLVHSGLYMNYRNYVVVSFDEPINPVAANGLSSGDASHFTVYNADTPTTTKAITYVGFTSDHKSAIVLLDSDIPEGKSFNIAIADLQDYHGNLAGVVDGVVTSSGDGSGGKIIFNEVLPGSGGKNAKTSSTIFWVELMNDGERSISLNGWAVEVSGGATLSFPELPILVLQPGELGVLAGNGYLESMTGRDAVVFHSADSFGEDTGLLIVNTPLGEQSDSINTSTMLKSGTAGSISLQRFVEASNKSIYWVADAPEYSPGLRGTPGKTNRTSVGGDESSELPFAAHSTLFYAAPNPFNPTTSIFLAVKAAGQVSVVVYDLRGRRVRTLYDQYSEPNAQMELVWDGDSDSGARVASGAYFVRMKAADGVPKPLKILLLK